MTSVLTLLAGIGIFLIACTMMSSNLESISGSKLKALFSKASKSKLLGVGIGALGTAAIQSSGATTVMVIGFVNAGIMSLAQAATMIYGANIGTTITGQIVALGMFGDNTLSTTVIFSSLAGVGAFILAFSKTDKWKKIGGILAGFGMLFVGLSMMSSSMEAFAELDSVKVFLASIDNALLLVVIGAILTAIIQSSSVMTSITIAMVVTGLISLDQGIFLTMGSNIGSCVVALIAGITGSRNAKRTSLIHLIFNISGVVVFMIVSCILTLVGGSEAGFGFMFEKLFPGAPQTQLAMFHTFFNIVTVIIVLPFTNQLVALTKKLIPGKSSDEEEKTLHTYYISDHMLRTPPLAVEQTKHEIVNMAEIAMKNWRRSLDMICTLNFSKEKEFSDSELELNYLNRHIVDFIVKLSELPLSENDRIFLSTAIHSVSDIERVGDYAENVVEYAHSLDKANESFSDRAINEINDLRDKIESLYEDIMKAYTALDLLSLEKAEITEDEIDNMTNIMADNHVVRLNAGVCSANVGAQYLSFSSDAERVADHIMNIGKAVRRFA